MPLDYLCHPKSLRPCVFWWLLRLRHSHTHMAVFLPITGFTGLGRVSLFLPCHLPCGALLRNAYCLVGRVFPFSCFFTIINDHDPSLSPSSSLFRLFTSSSSSFFLISSVEYRAQNRNCRNNNENEHKNCFVLLF